MIGAARSTDDGASSSAILRVYGQFSDLLRSIAVRRYRVPEEDVRALIHEVLVAYMRNQEQIRDERSWLVGTMYNQCRVYWRQHPPREELSENVAGPEVDVTIRLDADTILRHLSPRCRDVLRWRYYEELSSADIAARLHTTVDYARKLVYRCMARAREHFCAARGDQMR